MSVLRPPPPAGCRPPPPPAGFRPPPPPAGCRPPPPPAGFRPPPPPAGFRPPPPPAGFRPPASPPSPIVEIVPTALTWRRSRPGAGPTTPSAGVPSHSLYPCITSLGLPSKLMASPVVLDQKK